MSEVSKLIITQDFDAPIGEVWKALTDPDELKEWNVYVEDFDFRVDSEFSYWESSKKEFKFTCVFRKIVPFKQFTHTWKNPDGSIGVSTVTWNLEKLGRKKTRLTLVHDGVEDTDSYYLGWNDLINVKLVEYLALQDPDSKL